MSTMQLLDRIEKRRFVGREFLMWLWFESEVFSATLSTATHGEFGLWVESALVLSAGREATRIRGSQPASAREAKESVLRGKLPESAGMHLSWGDREISFTLKAETLAVGRLSGCADRAEFEGLLEALYSDFLQLRLGEAWAETVLPAINAWIVGGNVDADGYSIAREEALS